MSHPLRIPVLAVCLVALTLGCGDSSTAPQTGRIDLTFRYVVGDQPFSPNQSYYPVRGSGSSLFNIESLTYYVSHISIDGASGSGASSPDPILLDAVKASPTYENVISFTSVPAGTYNRVRFTFGMNEEDNVTGKWNARSQADRNMAWPDSLGGGYHHLISDGRFRNADGDTLGYNTHLGRVGTSTHFYEVDLDVAEFTLETGKSIRIPIVVNLLEFYNRPHDYQFPVPAFIMNNDSLQTVLEENAKSSAWTAGTPTPPDFEN